MSDFAQELRDAIAENYFVADDWIENLKQANEKHDSDIRLAQIAEFAGHQRQLESLAFFEKIDFTQPEKDAIITASNEIADLVEYIQNRSDVTLIELETDIAALLQKLPLDELFQFLRLSWDVAKRYYPLPVDIPEEVRDAFDIGVLARAQVSLNQLALRVKPVAAEKCLNQDDYSPLWFAGLEYRAASTSGKAAVDDHITLLRTRQSAQAAAAQTQALTPNVAGKIWSVIGWDDPWDFAKDVVLSIVPGYKALRWGRRLLKAKKHAARAKKYAEKIAKFHDSIKQAENKISKIQDAAKKIRRLKALSEVPAKIRAAFTKLEKADEQVRLLSRIGNQVKRDYLRGVVTTATADIVANRRSTNIHDAAVTEAARTAITDYLLTTPMFKRVAELRDIVGWTSLLMRQSKGDRDNLIAEYAVKSWLLEASVRLCMRIFSNLDLNAKIVLKELIDASGAATERLLRDLQIVPTDVITKTSRWVMSLVRKLAVEFLQKLVGKFLD